MRLRATIIVPTNYGILLVSHTRHGKPIYMLPGGGIKPNETDIDAAQRELYEETGLHVSNIQPLFEYENHSVFLANTYGHLRKRHETTHIRFYNQETKRKYKFAWYVHAIVDTYKNMIGR